MAYKPPKQTIVDNDLQNTPSSEAVFEALKLKIDEPTISGSTGQLLQLDGYVSGEAVVSWVNPPAGYALPSQTGNAEKVLATDGTSEYWAIEGVKTGYPADTVIVGRTKPAGLTGTANIIIGDGALNSLTVQSNNIAIGKNAASSMVLTGANYGPVIAIGFEALQNATLSAYGNEGSICIGYQAGKAITQSYANVYIGNGAGRGAGRHDNNVAIGHQAGNSGYSNTCVGYFAGNTPTNSMTAIGISALRSASGASNSALGANAGRAITSGSANTLLGSSASYYTSAGGVNLTTGNSNTLLGTESATLADNSVGAISLGRRAAAASKEFAVGSADYDIETVLLGRGGASQTVANAVKIQTMRASGTDTDMSVGTLTIAGAQGTGTGPGGDVIIATAAPAVSSGSSLNAHVEVMRVTDNGLVGIGTSTPAQKLEVVGAVKADEFTVTRGGGEVYRLDPHTHDEGTETTDFTINWSNGSVHTVTLNAAGPLVITMSNPVDGGAYALRVIQGATPGTVTWPANVKWPGGNPPVLSTNTGDIDVVNLLYYSDTATYYATFALAFA